MNRPLPAGPHERDRRFGLKLVFIGSFMATAGFSVPMTIWMGHEYGYHSWPGLAFLLYQAGTLWATWSRLNRLGLPAFEDQRMKVADWFFVAVALTAGFIMARAVVEDGGAGGIAGALLVAVICAVTSRLGFHGIHIGHELAGYADLQLRKLGHEPGWPPGRRYR